MIISSDKKLKVGTIDLPKYIWLESGFIETQPLFIIRETTLEEYLAEGPNRSSRAEYPYYYEVSTD